MDFSRGSKFKDGIRIAAGGYLVYLAVQILRDGVIGGQMTGAGFYVAIAASVVFLLAGAGVVIFSVRELLRENAAENAIEDKQMTGEAKNGSAEDSETDPEE